MEEFLKGFLEPTSYFIYAGLVYIYSKFEKAFRIKSLTVYYLFAGIFLSIGQLVIDNNWVYNVFFFVTVSFLSYFFYSTLSFTGSKKMVSIFYALNVIIFIINDIILGQIFQENNYVRSFYFFTIIIYSLLYLYERIKDVNELNILEQFEFWLVSGYLFYFMGCLCIVLYYKYPSVKQRGEMWIIQSLILFSSCVITSAGTLWLIKKKKVY